MPDRIARSVLADLQRCHDDLHGNPPLEPWVARLLYSLPAVGVVFLGFAIGGMV